MTKTLRTVSILRVNELPWPGYVINSHAQDHKYACHIGKTVPRNNHIKYWFLSCLFLKHQSCVSVSVHQNSFCCLVVVVVVVF